MTDLAYPIGKFLWGGPRSAHVTALRKRMGWS